MIICRRPLFSPPRRATLYKSITTDERGSQVIEFKDKGGKVVLKKVFAGDIPEQVDDWLFTYYVYDDFGNLVCVIQPKGVKMMRETGWSDASSDVINEFCFQYSYDDRDRMIAKKVPGAEAMYMVYDKWNRLVLTQDGNMRPSARWIYTKYDILNRPVYTGFYRNILLSQAQMQATVDNFYAESTAKRYETLANTDLGYTKDACFPEETYYDGFLTITHYDNYAWKQHYDTKYQQKDNVYDGQFYSASNNFPFPQLLVQNNQVKGMVTGTVTYVMKNNTTNNIRLIAVVFYDEKGRAIQTKSDNVTQGFDINTTQYSFTGQPLMSLQTQQNASCTDLQTLITVTKMNYDANGRLLSIQKDIKQNIGTQPQHGTGEKIIVENEYDELGQLKKKRLGPTDLSHEVEGLAYHYNIHGWLKDINKDIVAAPNVTGYFGMELAYDNVNVTAGPAYSNHQLNGNIAGITWASAGDQVQRRYDFTYDNANRLLNAAFIQSDGAWTNSVMDFTSTMGNGSTTSSA